MKILILNCSGKHDLFINVLSEVLYLTKFNRVAPTHYLRPGMFSRYAYRQAFVQTRTVCIWLCRVAMTADIHKGKHLRSDKVLCTKPIYNILRFHKLLKSKLWEHRERLAKLLHTSIQLLQNHHALSLLLTGRSHCEAQQDGMCSSGDIWLHRSAKRLRLYLLFFETISNRVNLGIWHCIWLK